MPKSTNEACNDATQASGEWSMASPPARSLPHFVATRKDDRSCPDATNARPRLFSECP
eukprot:CAMPEP_0172762010 /NCGR_PEP_ID=MMETSP1074-20121228/172641_1 /TAXON_ID=2916 /ORGANISM="Ceratium fusus, Strain PA161109" /LENGTH=57 /DNA_ID=CAMNT_0013596319 /DNA_START=217 /DNA_END=393 /DNA_ORIENTATION=-